MIAIAIFLTYSLQFYVPFEIIWKGTKHRFTSRPVLFEYLLRVVLVVCTGKSPVSYALLSNDILRMFQRVLIFLFFVFFCFLVSTVAVAIAVPSLGPVISLVGALCLSFLGLILPSCIDLVTNWEDPGLGRGYWRLWKNVIIIAFGILGLVTGVYSSMIDIIKMFNEDGGEHK